MTDSSLAINPSPERPEPLSFARVAEALGGERVGPSEDFHVAGVTTLEESRPGWVSFVANPRFLADAAQSQASGFLTTARTVVPDRPCIVLDNVWKGMLFLLNHFHPGPAPCDFVHPSAVIGKDVSLGKHVYVGPCAVIEDEAALGDSVRIGAHGFVGRGTRIGPETLLHPNVTVLHNCELGARVILHPGVVIGADGFKYEFIDGQLTKIPQVGRVVIEDDVEIGANSCIDRASLTETRIGRGTKIDNLCQLAHNVTVGEGSVMAAQVGIAGSTTVGRGCFLAGQVGLVDNITIGDRAKLGAQAGVKNDVPPDVYYLGSPAMPARQFMRIVADTNHIGDMRKRLKELEQKLETIEQAGIKKSGETGEP